MTKDDLISRQDALDAIRPLQTYKLFEGDDMILVDKAEVQTELMSLPSALPCPEGFDPANPTEQDKQEIAEALDYIRQTLELPPEESDVPDINVGDMISRQAAIDKFEPWLKVEGYSEGELNMLKAVLYELRFLPSAGQGLKWVPVSDRLPKEDGYYIVTDNSGGAAWVVCSFFCLTDDGEPWWEYTNVTAWMEKPSPYKGE